MKKVAANDLLTNWSFQSIFFLIEEMPISKKKIKNKVPQSSYTCPTFQKLPSDEPRKKRVGKKTILRKEIKRIRNEFKPK